MLSLRSSLSSVGFVCFIGSVSLFVYLCGFPRGLPRGLPTDAFVTVLLVEVICDLVVVVLLFDFKAYLYIFFFSFIEKIFRYSTF